MKLEQLIESLSPSHQTELQPAASSTTVTFSEKDQSALSNPTTKALRMGLFYVTLTTLLYGGDSGESFSPVVRELDLLTKPDIVNPDQRLFLESKAVCSGHHGLVLDIQLDGYASLQEHFPGYKTAFAFYRHALRGIKSSWQGTATDLFQELAMKTAYLVVLPYSVVKKFQAEGQRISASSVVSRYQNPRSTFDNCTCIRSSTFTRLAIEPEQVLHDIDLDLGEYAVRRYRSPSCTINSIPLKSFPIIQITEKEPEKQEPVRDYCPVEDLPF
ncbi:hypothetical protein HYT55_00700 [Candidatus Woesearchaeota archaeon]|nr:hypothetical protein [Candidatus Woesearchaeota archaeon]